MKVGSEFTVVPRDRAMEFEEWKERVRRGEVSIEALKGEGAPSGNGSLLPDYGAVVQGRVLSYEDFRTDEDYYIHVE